MLSKIKFKPGVNRENTRYTTEGGWYESDKVRFRQGTPEKIGGWAQLSLYTFLGVCRSLWNWVTLGAKNLIGVGTNLKFYICSGGTYSDITPIRATVALTDPFTTSVGLPTVVVVDASGGFTDGDFVTFTGGTAVGGLTITGEYQITYINATSYRITAAGNAGSTATGGGSVSAAYQINSGSATLLPISGWGSSGWGMGAWGTGVSQLERFRLWSQTNFGEDLIFGPRYGGLYYWTASTGVSVRGVAVSSLPGASDVPVVQLVTLVSDVSRFVICFGTNAIATSTMDPLLIRWSDQESAIMWTPAATNQSGDIRLSHGSKIVAAMQTRQEILVWTDSALYSMQYVGYPAVWQVTLLADNISIISPNAPAVAGSVVYWMGVDKFYKYDGHVSAHKCDLRQYVYSNINQLQAYQVFGSTNEGFNEVWWFYCVGGSTTITNYVVFNYEENVWYYGTMGRTAWLDSGISPYPLAATYSNNLVNHEFGLDDQETSSPQPINAYILSSEFDINDGHNFGFVWRILPDLTFQNSTSASPQVTMTLYPLQNSGSGYTNPASVAGANYANVTRTSTAVIEQFTGQIYTRVRGRQMALKIESNQLGCTWQLGSPRIDLRPDGRR